MLKKAHLFFVLIVALVIVGCGNKTGKADESTNFGYMMGAIGCIAMDIESAPPSADDSQAIAEKYGFGDWSSEELDNYIKGLTVKQNREISDIAVAYVNENCLSGFKKYGIEPNEMVEFLMTSDN